MSTLRNQAKNCNFGALENKLIRDTTGISSDNVRRTLLKETDLTLSKALRICQISELTEKHSKALSTPKTATTASVDAVQIKHRNIYSKMKHTMRENPSISSCRNCGGTHPAKRDQCPAFGQQCHTCGKQNHFKSQCRSTKSSRPNRQINQLYAETNSSSESDDTFTIEGLSLHDDERKIDKEGHCFVTVNDKQLNLKVDTGAKCNVMSLNTYKLVRHNEAMPMQIGIA